MKNNVPDQHQTYFDIHAWDKKSNSWNSFFSVLLNAPSFEIGSKVINDSVGGNNNHRLDPGETIKLKTPQGKELVIKSYMTAKERNEIKRTFLEGVKIDPNQTTQEAEAIRMKELDASIMLQAERKTIEQLVISYDGKAERILERLDESRPEEYDFVVSELNKVTKGNFPQAK